ncbi:MAG: hypothetical protein JXM71_12860, partial [Spirochaetales bacterium]|nr:hypothetical protein [Spirochaetales bacterium]
MNDEHGSTFGPASRGNDQPVDGVVYPVEFELRVIYLLEAGSTLPADLYRVLVEQNASPGPVRALAVTAG